MRSSMLWVACLVAFAACNGSTPPPPVPGAATTRSSPPAATSGSSGIPADATSTEPAPASPASSTATPPDPGSVDLTFSGDYAKRVTSEGASCEDKLWLRSNDLLGPGAEPPWTLLEDGNLRLQLGPFATMRVFGSAGGGRGVARTASGYELDTPLVASKGKPGKVHVKGTIRCGKPASGVVPDSILAILRESSATHVRRQCTQDFGRAETQACASVVVAGKPEGKGRELVLRLRERLPAGWVAFVGTSRWLGDEKHEAAVEVVVGPGRDQFDILRLAQSNAINFDMETEALVKKLRAYHALVPIDIWHAETDTIELDLARVPPNLGAFAKDVYAFCPDIVDQGVGDVAALEKEIATTKRLFLWWD